MIGWRGSVEHNFSPRLVIRTICHLAGNQIASKGMPEGAIWAKQEISAADYHREPQAGGKVGKRLAVDRNEPVVAGGRRQWSDSITAGYCNGDDEDDREPEWATCE